MTAVKTYSNLIIKILICLCLVFVALFVQPKEKTQQAEAIVPLLLWGGAIVASAVAEEVIQMGLRHYTSDGKVTTKNKTKKIADAMIDNIDVYDFDFLKNNPKRKADGSLEVYPSANDRAKIARKIADEFGDLMDYETARQANQNIDDFDIVPLDGTDTSIYAHSALTRMYDVDETEISATKSSYKFISIIDGSVGLTIATDRAYDYRIVKARATYHSLQGYDTSKKCGYADFYQGMQTNIPTTPAIHANGCSQPTWQVHQALRFVQGIGKDIIFGGGMSAPSTIQNVYPAPANMSPEYKLPNYDDLSNKPLVLKNVYPVSESDDDTYTWETVNNDYETDNSIGTKIEQNVDTYLENGDLYQNTYTTDNVNNYYTDSNYPVKSGEVTVIVDNEVIVPPTDVDVDADGFKYCVDKSSGQVVPCKDIEAIDGGLLAYVRDSYNYAVNAVQTAVNGLETIATGSVGLIALYSEIFDWLPDEVTVLLTSGLMLMIGLRVFRK